jgi:hypothetical protein
LHQKLEPMRIARDKKNMFQFVSRLELPPCRKHCIAGIGDKSIQPLPVAIDQAASLAVLENIQ